MSANEREFERVYPFRFVSDFQILFVSVKVWQKPSVTASVSLSRSPFDFVSVFVWL